MISTTFISSDCVRALSPQHPEDTLALSVAHTLALDSRLMRRSSTQPAPHTLLCALARGMATAPEYDLVVIGGGPGGYVAAIKAAQLGMKVGANRPATNLCSHDACG